MKYKARIEKLDWKGRVQVSFREFEDEFNPVSDDMFAEFVKTGNFPVKRLKSPNISWWQLARLVAPPKSKNSFDDYDTGLCAIVGEHFSGMGVQYIVMMPGRDRGWVETDSDVMEETYGG